MLITQIKLNGFRNFKKTTINVCDKTLIIGANDVGKSNMLLALRILLDRSFSELDVEPRDCDFFCHEKTDELSIIIKFENVKEDCVISRLPGKISDDGELFIAYKAWKKDLSYAFYAGPSETQLEEIQDRFYRKAFHLRYISSNRDLSWYIKKEKRNLISDSKNKRAEKEVTEDKAKLDQIETHLNSANEEISQLSYVNKATEAINNELQELSFHHSDQEVVFDVGSSDINAFLDNLHLVSKVNSTSLAIGGDGRNNQIFLALWAARNEIKEESPLEVTFYCIEEPEAHLHPHQQRKLAEYLVKKLNGQVFITSHSPQIASEFSPNSIVRLLKKETSTKAANKGCSKIIEEAVHEFGYRLNVVSAEAFFANAVFLVEGPSEILFYKVLARELGIDLDKLNISILVADGIGFKTFIGILTALEITWVLRTDNDIFKIPGKNQYRMAGVQRAIGIYKSHCDTNPEIDKQIKESEKFLKGMPSETPNSETNAVARKIASELESFDIFLSDVALEQDILNQGLLEDVKSFCKASDESETLECMIAAKATFMYEFLRDNSGVLKKLKDSNLSKPLFACKKLIEGK